jgi:hypothetical protein
LAIARASALIDPYLTRKPKVAGHKIFAKLDVLPREGVGVEQNRFHVDIYIEAILRAELSEYALAEVEGDFLTGAAGAGFVPSPPELIKQARIYMGKALWKLRVYKTWLEQPDWLRPQPPKPEETIEDWMIPPGEAEEYNMLMRKFRSKWRVNDDGWQYMLVELPMIEAEIRS